MEHRWSQRKAMAGNVIVECPRLGMVRASLRDMSMGGLFVETGTTALPVNAPVAVSIPQLQASPVGDNKTLQAMVVRQTAEGAGLMFVEPRIDAVRLLREVLYGAEQVPVPRRRSGVLER